MTGTFGGIRRALLDEADAVCDRCGDRYDRRHELLYLADRWPSRRRQLAHFLCHLARDPRQHDRHHSRHVDTISRAADGRSTART